MIQQNFPSNRVGKDTTIRFTSQNDTGISVLTGYRALPGPAEALVFIQASISSDLLINALDITTGSESVTSTSSSM
ncbi:MAG: hypothetical protein ACKOQY_00440, partial [Bacteroidota bacterium]